MISIIKPVIYGCLLTIGLGIIGYLSVVFYHTWVVGMDDSSILVDIIRSKKSMYISMPYTLVVVFISCVLVIKKMSNYHMLVSVLIVLVTAASITTGPLKIISIHMSYLPIVIGGLIGALVGKKLNNHLQRNLLPLGRWGGR